MLHLCNCCNIFVLIAEGPLSIMYNIVLMRHIARRYSSMNRVPEHDFLTNAFSIGLHRLFSSYTQRNVHQCILNRVTVTVRVRVRV